MADNNKPNFFEELKRRKIYRVGIVYAITGWLLVQIADTTFSYLGIPDRVATTLIIIVIIGFPVALILAWAFEISPEGIIRTSSGSSKSNPLPDKRKKPFTSAITIIILAVLVIAQFVFFTFFRNPDSGLLSEEVREERVAVAPFNNFTGDHSLDAFGYMASEWITSGLRQLEVKTSSPEIMRRYKDNVGILPGNPNNEVSLFGLTSAKYVVTGSYYLEDDFLQITSRLESAISGEIIHDFPNIRGSISKKEGLITELSDKIKGFWAVKEASIKSRINAPKYDAYQIYLDCSLSDWSCYLDALEVDSTFILAWTGLYYASSLWGIDSLMEQARSYISDHWDECTQFEKNGSNFVSYGNQKRYKEALEALNANFELDPLDPMVIHESAFFYLCLNQPEKAAERFEILFSDHETFKEIIIPNSYYHYLEALNRSGESRKAMDFAQSFKNDQDVIRIIRDELNWALLKEGKFDELHDWIEFYQANDMHISYLNLAYQFNEIFPNVDTNIFTSRANEQISGRSTLGEVGSWSVMPLRNFSSKAFALYVLKEYDQAEKLIREYTAQDYANYTDNWWSKSFPLYGQLWIDGFLGTIYARQGKTQLAMQQIEQLESQRSKLDTFVSRKGRGVIPYYQARIYAILGEKDMAVASLKKSKQDGRLCEHSNFTNDWDLANLYDYEPFIELLKFQ